MELKIITDMTTAGVKPGYYAERDLVDVIRAHAEATSCILDAHDILLHGGVFDCDALRCAVQMQRVAAAELLIRGCEVSYDASQGVNHGAALVTEPKGGSWPRTATVRRRERKDPAPMSPAVALAALTNAAPLGLGLDVPLTTDFYALTAEQAAVLMGFADNWGYRAPRSASGSRLRYFFAYVVRQAGKAVR